jgi:endo-1,4-beta-xylanase
MQHPPIRPERSSSPSARSRRGRLRDHVLAFGLLAVVALGVPSTVSAQTAGAAGSSTSTSSGPGAAASDGPAAPASSGADPATGGPAPSTDDPSVVVPPQAPKDPAAVAAKQVEPAPTSVPRRTDVPLGATLDWTAFQAQTPAGAEYRAAFEQHFTQFTPSVEMKMDRLWPSMPVMLGTTVLSSGIDFREMDRVANYARQTGKKLRGHTLVWCTASTSNATRTQGDPPWIGLFDLLYRTPQLRKAALRAYLKMYIQQVVRRYDDVVRDWDVTNEFFEDPTTDRTNGDGRYRGCFWTRELGPSVIADAFRWAREASSRPLYANEVGLDYDNDASRFALAELRRFRAEGVPIDGFGFQMHAPTGGVGLLAYDRVLAQFQRFTALGLDVQVTEMDVPFVHPVPAYDPTSAEAETQRQIYANVASACQHEPRCKGFTTWGVGDLHTFRQAETTADLGFEPLLFDRQWRPKAAWTDVVSRLGG